MKDQIGVLKEDSFEDIVVFEGDMKVDFKKSLYQVKVYSVFKGDIKMRCRTLLIQICESEDVRILKGVVSKDHIHMHLEYRP